MAPSTTKIDRLPKLDAQEENWSTAKHRLGVYFGEHQLGRHIKGIARKPVEIALHEDDDQWYLPTDANHESPIEEDKVEGYHKALEDWESNESKTRKAIYAVISDTSSVGDVRAHLVHMASLKERLAQSGMKVEDVKYLTYIRTSLANCEQSNEIFSSADTYEKVSRKTITSQDLISLITNKVVELEIKEKDRTQEENRALVTAHKKGWAKPKESTSKGREGAKLNGKGKLCSNCQKPRHGELQGSGRWEGARSSGLVQEEGREVEEHRVAGSGAQRRPPVIFDTGATRPIVPEEHVFDKLTPTSVETANKNSPLKAVGSGNATFLPPLNNASASLGRSGTPFMRPMRPARSSRYLWSGFCEICVEPKAARKPFPDHITSRARSTATRL
ncbi:hypothetical protein GGG16DRAFT_119355 [Schizophyllum commune]